MLAAEGLNNAAYGETTVLVSASQRQARELLRKASTMLPIVLAASNGNITVKRKSDEAIELSTGGRVISLPAVAETVQGYTGHVVIDEAAWIPNVEEVWQAIVPTITQGDARLSVVSTPGPRSGLFYKLWSKHDQRWSKHKVSIHDALAGGVPHDIESLRSAISDETTWRAAYECEFVDEATALLPYELLSSRVDDELPYNLEVIGLNEPRSCYAGYDVGRKRDISVLVVIERTRFDSFVWRGAVELVHEPFDTQYALLRDVLKYPSVKRLCIDESGLGMQIAEQLQRKHPTRVEPITITASVKEGMASRILACFHKGSLRIPNHRPLIDDLHSVQRSVTASGNVRYAAPRDDHGHADRWTALSLALEAASTTSPIGSLAPIDDDDLLNSRRSQFRL